MEEGINRIDKLISSLNLLFLSWWDHLILDSIRMLIKHILLYILSMIPVVIPHTFFKRIDSLLSSFFKKSRISFTS